MNRDKVILIITLIVFGVASYLLLPDGWRLASLPLALLCASLAQRFTSRQAGMRRTDEEKSIE